MRDQVIYSPKSRKMRESNERSRDLWKILEKEFKIYKYARSEHEAGNPPRDKHEATLCSAKEIPVAATFGRRYYRQSSSKKISTTT